MDAHFHYRKEKSVNKGEKNCFIEPTSKPIQNKIEVLSDTDKKSKTSYNIPSMCPSYISVFWAGVLQCTDCGGGSYKLLTNT